MGLMLDSTALVAGERSGKNARQLLESVTLQTGDDSIALSVITVLELAHGVARADTVERRERRQRFLDELLIGVPIQPITALIALRAGQIDGRSRASSVSIPLALRYPRPLMTARIGIYGIGPAAYRPQSSGSAPKLD